MKRTAVYLRTGIVAGAILGLAPAGSRAAQNSGPALPDTIDLKTAIAFAVENNFTIRQARQVLYAGGGVAASVRSARLAREAAVYELEGIINQQLLAVRTQFDTVLLDKDKIGVQEENVRLLEKQLQDAQSRFNAGSTSNFDVLRARVALANGQPPLIQARLSLAESTLSVDVQVRQAYSSLVEAWELVQASGKTVDQAQEALRLANVRYGAGTATQLDVLTSQVALTQARLDQLQAFYGYNVCARRWATRTNTAVCDPFSRCDAAGPRAVQALPSRCTQRVVQACDWCPPVRKRSHLWAFPCGRGKRFLLARVVRLHTVSCLTVPGLTH